MTRKRIDLTGQRFGRLVAVKDAGYAKHHSRVWECKCDCGNTTSVKAENLTRGYVRSCGCLANAVQHQAIKKVQGWVLDHDMKEHTRISLLTRKISSNNTSGIKGVSWNSARKMWIAQLEFQHIVVLYSSFAKKEDAIRARREAEEKYFKPILKKYHRDKE